MSMLDKKLSNSERVYLIEELFDYYYITDDGRVVDIDGNYVEDDLNTLRGIFTFATKVAKELGKYEAEKKIRGKVKKVAALLEYL